MNNGDFEAILYGTTDNLSLQNIMWLFDKFFAEAVKIRRGCKVNAVACKRNRTRACRIENLENRRLLTSFWQGNSAANAFADWQLQTNWRDGDVPVKGSIVVFDVQKANAYVKNVGSEISTLTVQKSPTPTNTNNRVIFNQGSVPLIVKS